MLCTTRLVGVSDMSSKCRKHSGCWEPASVSQPSKNVTRPGSWFPSLNSPQHTVALIGSRRLAWRCHEGHEAMRSTFQGVKGKMQIQATCGISLPHHHACRYPGEVTARRALLVQWPSRSQPFKIDPSVLALLWQLLASWYALET
jgi:hypothetical protein